MKLSAPKTLLLVATMAWSSAACTETVTEDEAFCIYTPEEETLEIYSALATKDERPMLTAKGNVYDSRGKVKGITIQNSNIHGEWTTEGSIFINVDKKTCKSAHTYYPMVASPS